MPVKLIIQIPCYNEEKTLLTTLEALPTTIEDVDDLEILIIDDGNDVIRGTAPNPMLKLPPVLSPIIGSAQSLAMF